MVSGAGGGHGHPPRHGQGPRGFLQTTAAGPRLQGPRWKAGEWPDPNGHLKVAAPSSAHGKGAHHSRCRKAVETSGTGATGMAGGGGIAPEMITQVCGNKVLTCSKGVLAAKCQLA